MKITVYVAYASKTEQVELAVSLLKGSNVRIAIERSGLLRRFPEINLSVQTVGIWGRSVSLEAEVQAGDRIEIYRPLEIDPKEARRLRELRRSSL